jgi:hypothetical protein
MIGSSGGMTVSSVGCARLHGQLVHPSGGLRPSVDGARCERPKAEADPMAASRKTDPKGRVSLAGRSEPVSPQPRANESYGPTAHTRERLLSGSPITLSASPAARLKSGITTRLRLPSAAKSARTVPRRLPFAPTMARAGEDGLAELPGPANGRWIEVLSCIRRCS